VLCQTDEEREKIIMQVQVQVGGEVRDGIAGGLGQAWASVHVRQGDSFVQVGEWRPEVIERAAREGRVLKT
jgi:hypothetical protein